jgi:decaprenylphospho-beta-D-ribofuranose 2-oxidase
MLADGTVVTCSKDKYADLFHATCGGMGLTGIVLGATIALKPIKSAYIHETIIKAQNLHEVLDLFEQHSDYTYSVAWVDCLTTGRNLGRSLLMPGTHRNDNKIEVPIRRRISIPLELPDFLLTRYSVGLFNALYYRKARKSKIQRDIDYDSYFYPLDKVLHWNRMYGKNGFVQYQLVIAKQATQSGLKTILARIAESKRGSFLTVLKLFGKANCNYLTFPMEGYSLALDFKIAPGLLGFLKELDRIVLDHGGRLYLAKDARMSEQTFKQSYRQWKQFFEIRKQYRADKMFQSLQSQRLGI